MPSNPPARNAPCPCGSGKRYKDCHGALSPSTPLLPPAVPVRSGQAPGTEGPEWIASVLQQALAHQSSGAAAEAEAGYRRVLAAAPDHFDALHMLGLIRHQRGAHEEALDLIQRAIGQLATHAPAYSNLGLVLHALNRLPEAIAAFDRAMALQPDFTEALSNRGNALHQQARYREAIESFHQALAFNPKQPTVLSNLGNALFELGQYDEAAQAFARLVSLVPEYDWAPGYLLNCRLHSCNWAGLDEVYGNVAAAIRAGKRAIVPFSLLAVSDSPAEQLACARIYSAAHSRNRIAHSATCPPISTSTRRRI
jgi:protein O-GlcNAc transferase